MLSVPQIRTKRTKFISNDPRILSRPQPFKTVEINGATNKLQGAVITINGINAHPNPSSITAPNTKAANSNRQYTVTAIQKRRRFPPRTAFKNRRRGTIMTAVATVTAIVR